ncbi:MAG: hypothetical protein HXY39_20770 [Chloroflexi bacterium]|nr:hypothetical protein [Chloroflexota bacterium]
MTTSSSSDPEPALLIQQGLDALFAGDRGRAVRLIVRAIEHNPNNEHAWLGLARVVTSAERRRYCLERALSINPHNLRTRAALREIRGGSAVPVQQPAPVPVVQHMPHQDGAQPAAEQERAVGDSHAPWYIVSTPAGSNGGVARHSSYTSTEPVPFNMKHVEEMLQQSAEHSPEPAAPSRTTVGREPVASRRRSAPVAAPLILRPVTFTEDGAAAPNPDSAVVDETMRALIGRTASDPVPDRSSLVNELVQPRPSGRPHIATSSMPLHDRVETLRTPERQHGAIYRSQIVGALVCISALSLLLFVVLLIVGRMLVV